MSLKKYHLVIARTGFASVLASEFQDRWNLRGETISAAAIALDENAKAPNLDDSVFARQYLPRAVKHDAKSIDDAVAFVVERLLVMVKRANRQAGRWTLHSYALDDDPALARAIKIEKSLLEAIKAKIPALHRRYTPPKEFLQGDGSDLLIQVYLPKLDEIWFSSSSIASGVSRYMAGIRKMDHQADSPSRSSHKLEEAFTTMGMTPKPGDTAVDLGAAPGGWTYTLARYGANVTAIDHAELSLPRGDKLLGTVTHLKENGLKHMPASPVDWLCCDMVIGPRETLRVLTDWFEAGAMRRFVVNIKLPQEDPWPVIKEALALLSSQKWDFMRAKHLYHDRREITLMGSR